MIDLWLILTTFIGACLSKISVNLVINVSYASFTLSTLNTLFQFMVISELDILRMISSLTFLCSKIKGFCFLSIVRVPIHMIIGR